MSDSQYDEIRRKVEKRYKERQGLIIHFSIYLIVNLMLWILWAVTSLSFPWPMIVTTGWGMGMVAHFLSYYFQYGRGAERREDAIQREVEREMARRQGGDYVEKPKRNPAMRLTEDGELEDVIDDDEINGAERRGRR